MRFGAMNSPLRALAEEILTVASLGFDYLELTMDPPFAHHADVGRDLDRIRGLLDAHGLGLICHLPTFVSTADLMPGIRKASVRETLDALAVASALGSGRVVLHPSFFFGLGPYVLEQSQRYAMESLEEILDKAADLHLKVYLENMFPRARWMVTAEDFAPVMRAFPHVDIALDIGHAYIEGGTQRVLGFIQSYPTRIAHVHVSDNGGKGDDHLPIGVGRIDFRTVLAELAHVSYEGDVTFEVFSPDKDYLRISREKFLQLWHEVQGRRR
jgi:sugar phosphate isomerase/epimerase